MKKLIFLFGIISILSIASQDLTKETIRQFTNKKQSIYFDKGVFHNGGEKSNATLVAVRHHFHVKENRERVVFDFEESKIPRIYGYLDKKEKKIYIDFFKTSTKNLKLTGIGKFTKAINFYPIQKDILSVEIVLKSNVSLNIFYLEGKGTHAKLVLDIKK